MNERQLRQKAAELARDCRKIEKSGAWTIRDWNRSVRTTVHLFMDNMRHWARVNDTWSTS